MVERHQIIADIAMETVGDVRNGRDEFFGF
jgi:hypothetical protein